MGWGESFDHLLLVGANPPMGPMRGTTDGRIAFKCQWGAGRDSSSLQGLGFAKWDCKSGARAELLRTLEGRMALSSCALCPAYTLGLSVTSRPVRTNLPRIPLGNPLVLADGRKLKADGSEAGDLHSGLGSIMTTHSTSGSLWA